MNRSTSLPIDELLNRKALLEILPDGWPGLEAALSKFERVDSVAVAIVRYLLKSSRAALEQSEIDETRQAILELLGGSVVTIADYDKRVTELLRANSDLVHKNRELERELVELRRAREK